MSFEIGNDVRFKHTGDSARITKDFHDGSFMVWCYDTSEEIVAFADDIVLAKDFKIDELQRLRHKLQNNKKLSTEEVFFGPKALNKGYVEPQPPTAPLHIKKQVAAPLYNKIEAKTEAKIEGQTEHKVGNKIVFNAVEKATPKVANVERIAPTSTGLQLAFLPNNDGGYIIYLINDTPNSVSFLYERYMEDYCEQELRHTIPPFDFYPIDEFRQNYFNQNSIIDFVVDGLNFKQEIKLKYKSFVNKYQAQTPLISAPTYNFLLFPADYNPLSQKPKAPAEDLKSYTQKQIANREELAPKVANLTPTEQRAQFPRVLDLHIEALIADPNKIVGSAIGFQLNKMEAYINKAIQLGIDEVVLIHGIGDGKLKDAVKMRLRTHPLVAKIINEHHPLYGFGATEVKLRS
jgi:hypothetical protein